jgi:thioredoxin reductase/NAD-dependent dihydropyrimidine dehydrogenase PreA subunit
MGEVLIEQVLIYGTTALLIVVVLFIYVRNQRRDSNKVEEKITQAKEDGLHEPISLYPLIDLNRCIKSGACVTACPEHDIIGIKDGRAAVINAVLCVGHGACLKACPVEAITLMIGTEKFGVDLPVYDVTFQTNIPGIYIAGEIGGMGLIRNAVAQGREAVENLAKNINKSAIAEYDVLVVGAGPAGISGTLAAKKAGLKVITLEQETLGGTVATYPRSKVIMTHPMDLPLYGKVKLYETSKPELIDMWTNVINKHDIVIKENTKVQTIEKIGDVFHVETLTGEKYTTKSILLAIGRRGTPRKLGIPGEMTEKVAYRLLEPEDINGKNIAIVGAGDSALEGAMSLCDNNTVTLFIRENSYTSRKKRNIDKMIETAKAGKVDVKFTTSLTSIEPDSIHYLGKDMEMPVSLENDLVFIFAGGELPSGFLKKSGIDVVTKRGEILLKR